MTDMNIESEDTAEDPTDLCALHSDLPHTPIPAGWNFRDIQLELSLKPFYDTSPGTRERVLRELFDQWKPLWRHAESVSVMLWVGEGSEILEYDGDLDSTFDWGRYHGAANPHSWGEKRASSGRSKPDHNAIGVNGGDQDPERKGIHSRSYLYREHPAVFTYGWLRDLVADIKRIGNEITGRTVYVGETFDIGPEFAVSRFKYKWHREILGDGPLFKEQFISCEAVLHGDDRTYAAYPDGIPDGTRIGTFLGAQLSELFADCGFDFLWLSNGFGFSLEPWAMVGEVFDGETYHPEKADGIRERILTFWRDLRAAFPMDFPIRSRGTNLATGIDIGSDASPLKDIYEGGFNVDAPVNSPWAALDGDFGLELSGWMSHIARHPGDTFRFRFYTHDPWWLNSPWLDRYNRTPHDILLPLSVSRLQSDGSVELPRDIAFLSCDDSHGRMPVQVPNEVTAHILKARETAPDAPGPFVWVYPFDAMHAMPPDRALHADAFIGACINEGLPLNTVADLTDLPKDIPQGLVLLSPVPEPGSAEEDLLASCHRNGAQLLLYGPLAADSVFRTLLGIDLAEGLEGDFEMADGRNLAHLGLLSGGGCCETGGTPMHTGILNGETRTLSATAERLAWTRASLSTAEYDPDDPKPLRGPILRPLDAERFWAPGELIRGLLTHFGWRISAEVGGEETRFPYLTIHRHHNACFFSGHHRDERAILKVRHPLGAPLLKGFHNRVVEGCTEITGQAAWQAEVRVFLAEGEDGMYHCWEPPPVMHGVYRRMLVSGCSNATLSFLVETGHTDKLRILRDPCFPYFVGEHVDPVIEETPHGGVVTVPEVDGTLLFEW